MLAEDPATFEEFSSQLMAYDFMTIAHGKDWPDVPANLKVPRDTILDHAYENVPARAHEAGEGQLIAHRRQSYLWAEDGAAAISEL
jgi:hypothetical protein